MYLRTLALISSRLLLIKNFVGASGALFVSSEVKYHASSSYGEVASITPRGKGQSSRVDARRAGVIINRASRPNLPTPLRR